MVTNSVTLTNPSIEGFQSDRPVINHYFATLNAGEFAQTATLFTETGQLYPPFASVVAGREAIAQYLAAEAMGMQLLPHTATEEPLKDGNLQIQVVGKVKTTLFSVNVAWLFVLTPEEQILGVAIKLLASPQELLKLRR